MKLLNIGFGNLLNPARIVVMLNPDSSPVKRMIQEARDLGTAVDATRGRRTRSVIVTDSGHIILSAAQCETLSARLSGEKRTDKE